MNRKLIVALVARSIGGGKMNVGCPDASSTGAPAMSPIAVGVQENIANFASEKFADHSS